MFKERLKELRKKKSMTQKELANILHVSQQTIASWEVGRSFPDEETVLVISHFFDISIDYLFGREVSVWPTHQNVIEIGSILDNQTKITYAGEELDEEEEEYIRQIVRGALWKRLQKKKGNSYGE